ncbi:hypothetical protein O181_012494 [Austropuccinia psidii MF-1]|uniref:DUF4939 domain-containing protein n=1 Tax=Austropuccinia psidii MF-1 TaxID=1389203 RepID=A0A9Q3GMX5_9BASI|nr:hypothetical protein [Austropuccinia psidii MF-1]
MSEGERARLGEVEDEEGGHSVEEEDSGETEVQDQSLVKIMDGMATIMGQLSQEEAHRDNSKALAFKNTSMKGPDSFDDTQAHKLRGFIQPFQLIFHNDPENFFDRRKILYSTSFLTGRAGKWIEPYLPNISNEYPSYLLDNWKLFEIKLFTLFGDRNDVRKLNKSGKI